MFCVWVVVMEANNKKISHLAGKSLLEVWMNVCLFHGYKIYLSLFK